MATQTAILKLPLPTVPARAARHFNVSSIMGIIFAGCFVAYFVVPHGGFLQPLFHFNVVFVLFLPVFALACSIISLRQIIETKERGVTLSYIALGISSLYFITALAVPIVLVGFYLVYAYLI